MLALVAVDEDGMVSDIEQLNEGIAYDSFWNVNKGFLLRVNTIGCTMVMMSGP